MKFACSCFRLRARRVRLLLEAHLTLALTHCANDLLASCLRVVNVVPLRKRRPSIKACNLSMQEFLPFFFSSRVTPKTLHMSAKMIQ